METRKLDEKATKQARARQRRGEMLLQAMFRLPYDLARCRRVGIPVRATLGGFVVDQPPHRSRPGCPRPRSARVKARHLARKRQHAARRTNWR